MWKAINAPKHGLFSYHPSFTKFTPQARFVHFNLKPNSLPITLRQTPKLPLSQYQVLFSSFDLT